jgi:uncharacterized protein YhfF
MQNGEKAAKFWQKYLASLPEDKRTELRKPEAWGFGRGAEMADELGGLVASGIKQATASLLWEYEAEGSVLPKPGDLSIILDGNDEPLCLIETIEVLVKPFNQVDECFAYDEGEGDRTLKYWRDAHWRFFNITCQEIGRAPSEEMPVVCERFRVVFPAA